MRSLYRSAVTQLNGAHRLPGCSINSAPSQLSVKRFCNLSRRIFAPLFTVGLHLDTPLTRSAHFLTMAPTVLHLRSETKHLEHRSALTPTTAKALLDAGYEVRVERNSAENPERIFDDSEFEAVGATLVPNNSWREAPADHIIVGLKVIILLFAVQLLMLTAELKRSFLRKTVRHCPRQFSLLYTINVPLLQSHSSMCTFSLPTV
jgi:hypothetical protein